MTDGIDEMSCEGPKDNEAPHLRVVPRDAGELWTREDVAAFLRVSSKTVSRLAVKGDIPSIVLGGRMRRYRPDAIRAWAAAQESA
ncbi:helix-turn-helix domain-containing protein [Myxococcus landrumensis]|uniref:Helix-turn-helix domain-containing protein n=2 Tax=Myxococcus landrumensis TaxID=2813577 RepID=A0ABX7N5K1_9BACT|nr:helix-turn-helix domain-containing protein [Myxococcus landrumus]